MLPESEKRQGGVAEGVLQRSPAGRASQIAVQPLALAVEAASATNLVAGSMVDVYANRPTNVTSGEKWAGPQRILEAVAVGRVAAVGGGLGSSTARSTVQLLVPTASIADVIDLVDAGAKVTLVPVPGSALRTAP